MFIASGPMGGYGKHGGQAIQMAVDEINASGGILGRKVVARVEDTKLKKDVALGLAKKFITQDKVDFLMGPTSSGLATALSMMARDSKKILILTQAAADELTGVDFHPYVFSTLSNAMMHSRSGARLMATKPYKRYMCIAPDYSYGHSSWDSFKAKLKELRPDVEIVGELFPKFLSKDYMAGETYAGVQFIKAAVERAGTTNPAKLIKAVERRPLAWETPEGWKVMRAEDHQVVEDCLWGETTFNDKYGFSLPKSYVSIQGEEICRTAQELKEVQANYKKKMTEKKTK
jgi:ABC-type branched-subunit amino acid transport system substrate-binding protein